MARSSKSSDPSVAPKSFEAALEELESTVERMEAGELSLEQSLAAHKRGLVLMVGAAGSGKSTRCKC